MSLSAVPATRFLRRTTLNANEYNTKFLMTDIEIARALISPEADRVTPLACKIYMGLKLAPADCWERDGVLHFVGDEREGKTLTAWKMLCEVIGVSSATASKALKWMHEEGIIGYYAGKNGVGIRIFLNRAASSIGVRQAPAHQKNLRLSPASSHERRASQNETGFNDSYAVRETSDIDISPTAPKSGAATDNGILRVLPTRAPGADSGALSREILAGIEPFVAEAMNREGQRTFVRIRDWLERFGIPKATRVAVHESYKVTSREGARDARQKRHEEWINVGRGEAAAPDSRRLDDEEVLTYAEHCIELFRERGVLTETSLSDFSAEAGGRILPEDTPRVREKIEQILEGNCSKAAPTPAPRVEARKDMFAAYQEYLRQAFEVRRRAIGTVEWEEMLAAERDLLSKENPASRIFKEDKMRMILEIRVEEKLRSELSLKSYDEFISGK